VASRHDLLPIAALAASRRGTGGLTQINPGVGGT